VAIVGNSGGPGILAVDACVAAGLEVPELSAGTQAALRRVVDPNAAVANPVDLVAGATPASYEQALQIVIADEDVDAVVVVSSPTFAAPSADVGEVVARLATSTPKTVLGCFLAAPDLPPVLRSVDDGEGVPVFASPEPAALALARAVRYATWRRRPPGAVPDLPDADVARARSILQGFLERAPDGGWLPAEAVTEVLRAVAVPVVADREVTGADDAAEAASTLGFPVALKAAGPEIVHKSDIGGVALGLTSAEAVSEAYRSMAADIGPAMTGGLVQQMAPTGVETIIGVVQDPLFGPLLMFGMGGTATELLGDQSFRILPVTDDDAAELVRSLRSSPLLFGYRGAPPCDTEALEAVLLRVALLAAAAPEMAELDLNPVIVSPDGAVAVDARMRVRPVVPGPPPGLRRM
jgi:acyl-CoA synthetase (NDP forming)